MNIETEISEILEIEARLAENDLWEARDFGELGYFIGLKHIADAVEEYLEEI